MFCFYYGFWITRQYFYEQKSIVKMTCSLPFVNEHVLPVSVLYKNYKHTYDKINTLTLWIMNAVYIWQSIHYTFQRTM